MSTQANHDQQVTQQFDPVASAYLTSAVHAQGEDLQCLAGVAEQQKPAQALDIGCGAGHAAFTIAPFCGQVIASDITPGMLATVAEAAAARGFNNLITQQAASQSLPFADAQFDLVCSRYSAHHWSDIPAALREARRVIKADGQFVMMDILGPASPVCDTHLQAIELLRDPSHVRDLSEAEWRAAVTAAGFAVTGFRVRRVRLEFASWIARMRTPEVYVNAIRTLLQGASPEVKAYLQLEDDLSFSPESMVLLARPV
ncbi:class I SAM-dependent methyltransferase [Silvimonas sp. JCM 19000]